MPTPEWCAQFVGLVDGEGHFALKKNRGRWCLPELRINMRADDRPMMEALRRALGFGRIYEKHRAEKRNPTVEFRVSKRLDCLALVRLFDAHPLWSRKRADYEIWRVAVLLHQDRKNAAHAHVEELMHQIRDIRAFKETV